MRYGMKLLAFTFLAVLVTGALVVEPASGQNKSAARGKGKEVVRTGDAGDRGTIAGAERGRTSGRSERGSTRDGRVVREDSRTERSSKRDGRVVVTRDRRGEQERAKDVYSRRDGDWDDDDWDDDEWEGDRDRGSKRGPKFCQNGQGHPVHGMSWCYEKGYGRSDDRWRRSRDLEDVIIGRPDRRTRVDRPRRIADIVEDVVLGRQ